MRDAVQNLARHPITVVPNPVDTLAVALGKARPHPVRPQIAMVCNGWGVWKNPEPGLIAFKQLQQQDPTVQMHLYGADFGPGQIAEQWCSAQGIKQGLHFHGALPHHQLLQELNKHDLLLHTSIEESFGMVIAEAMALGLPVVAGESSGAVPWVVGTHGCLCNVKMLRLSKSLVGCSRYQPIQPTFSRRHRDGSPKVHHTCSGRPICCPI